MHSSEAKRISDYVIKKNLKWLFDEIMEICNKGEHRIEIDKNKINSDEYVYLLLVLKYKLCNCNNKIIISW